MRITCTKPMSVLLILLAVVLFMVGMAMMTAVSQVIFAEDLYSVNDSDPGYVDLIIGALWPISLLILTAVILFGATIVFSYVGLNSLYNFTKKQMLKVVC